MILPRTMPAVPHITGIVLTDAAQGCVFECRDHFTGATFNAVAHKPLTKGELVWVEVLEKELR